MGYRPGNSRSEAAVLEEYQWDFYFTQVWITTGCCSQIGYLIGRRFLLNGADHEDQTPSNRNGSQPAETGQRCSQIIVDGSMKQKC